jgi:hypothetical protein
MTTHNLSLLLSAVAILLELGLSPTTVLAALVAILAIAAIANSAA